MPVYRLGPDPLFPPVHLAEPDGLLGVGGDLSPERLVAAYRAGIFPWYSEGMPILWWSPNPRFVISSQSFRLGRTLRKELRKSRYRWTHNEAFSDVIASCRDVERPGQDGTWLTDEMVLAYERLHQLGYCHSVEVWDGGELAGGLYGVSIGPMFFGESMFSRQAGASKFGFVRFAQWLFERGWKWIDCQIETEHLLRFGALAMNRSDFVEEIENCGVDRLRDGELLVVREKKWREK